METTFPRKIPRSREVSPVKESLKDFVSKYFFFKMVEFYLQGHLTVADIQEGALSLFPNTDKQALVQLGIEAQEKKVIVLSTGIMTPRALGEALYDTYLRRK